MKNVDRIRETVSTWPHVSVRSHRFGGSEFRFGRGELGHIHEGGIVDIPFPMPIRNALLAANFAEEHHFVPDSGWITFRICGDENVKHAVWLFRLSYLRYALRSAADPRELLRQESAALALTPQLTSLLGALVPASAA
jgi:Family of unknown function (DUF5519)